MIRERKVQKSAEKRRKARFSLRKEHVPMSSDDEKDVTLTSCSKVVRASRKVEKGREGGGKEPSMSDEDEKAAALLSR